MSLDEEMGQRSQRGHVLRPRDLVLAEATVPRAGLECRTDRDDAVWKGCWHLRQQLAASVAASETQVQRPEAHRASVVLGDRGDGTKMRANFVEEILC